MRPFLSPEQEALLASAGHRFTTEACNEAEALIAAQVGTRKLVAFQPPTRYDDDVIDDKRYLLSLYDESVAFYREIVEGEGRSQFQAKLLEAEAARQAARDRWPAK